MTNNSVNILVGIYNQNTLKPAIISTLANILGITLASFVLRSIPEYQELLAEEPEMAFFVAAFSVIIIDLIIIKNKIK